MLDAQQLNNPAYLASLLGKRVHYLGALHQVVDILTDGPQIVLRADEQNSIQDNAYGRAYRRIHPTVLVPIFTKPNTLNPDLDTLTLLD